MKLTDIEFNNGPVLLLCTIVFIVWSIEYWGVFKKSKLILFEDDDE